MIVIRNEQVKAFKDFQRQKYINELIQLIKKHFSINKSEEIIRSLVIYGIEDAAKFNIISKRDIGKYIGLIINYGKQFYHKQDLEWTFDILNNSQSNASNSKLDIIINKISREKNKE